MIKETNVMLSNAANVIGINYQKVLNVLKKDGDKLTLDDILIHSDSVKFVFSHSELTEKESNVVREYYNHIYTHPTLNINVNVFPKLTIFNLDLNNIATV